MEKSSWYQYLRKHSYYSVIVLTLIGCTTTTVVEEKAPLPTVPEYVKVPHPAGFDLADLKAIFMSSLAPQGALGEFADTCDDEFKKLSKFTQNKDELKKGAEELVLNDPERMHWCFYSKLSRLQEVLQSDSTWSTRQKKVLESFEFLSPIANAFLESYHDSRYLRWATQYYSKVSEWVFFKKVQTTPENTLLITSGARTDLEPWVQVQNSGQKPDSVYAKYGITFQPTVAAAVSPLEQKVDKEANSARAPASVAPESVPASAPATAPAPASLSEPLPSDASKASE